MRKIVLVILVYGFLFIFGGVSLAKGKEVGFTQEDRERLIRLESTLQVFMDQTNKRFEDMNKRFEDMNRRFEELREDMNRRFEQVDKRFEEQLTFMKIIVGLFTALVVAIIGFALWDRRTMIRRAKEETIEALVERGIVGKLLEALRELAKEDAKVARVLRHLGLL